MKKNEKQKLYEQTLEELKKKAEESKKELINLRMQKESGKLKDLHTYAKKRKEIAILETFIREKQLAKRNV